MPPVRPNFWLLPSFILMSSTEAVLPPYSAGKPPLMRLMFFTASGLNTEKKPSMWVELYTGASSSRIRFSSPLPPRTLKLAGAFAYGIHPGQRLDGFQHVHFAHKGGQFLYLGNIQLVHAGIEGVDGLFLVFAGDHHFIQLAVRLSQLNVLPFIGSEVVP